MVGYAPRPDLQPQASAAPQAAPSDMASSFGFAAPQQAAAQPGDMASSFGVSAAPAQPQPQGGNTLDYLASGINKGIGWTADLPFQAAKVAQDLVLPKGTPYAIPANPVSDYFAKQGWTQPDNGGSNLAHQGASSIGNFVGGSLIIGAGAKLIDSLGAAGMKLAPEVIRTIETMLPAEGGQAATTAAGGTFKTASMVPSAGPIAAGTRGVVQSMIPDTGAKVGAEAATAALAGGTSPYAYETGKKFSRLQGGTAQDQEAMGQLFSNLDAIGTGSWQGIVRNIGKVVTKGGTSLLEKIPGGAGLRDKMSENMTAAGREAGANNRVVDMIKPQLMANGADAALNDAKGVQDASGANFSVGEQLGSTGLLAAQRGLQQRMTPEQLAAEAQRQATNERLAQNYADQVTPKTPSIPSTFSGNPISFVINKVKGTVQTASDTAQAAMSKLGASVQAMSPSATAASGNLLRATMQKVRTTVKDAFTPEFNAIRADPAVLTKPYQDTGNEILNDYMAQSKLTSAKNLPPALKALKGDIDRLNAAEASGKMQKSLTIKDIMFRRQQIADAQRAADTGATPDFDAARQLGLAKTKLDKMLDGLPLGQQYQELRSRYRDQYIDRFENDTAFKIDSQNGRGQYQTYPEHVARLGIATDKQAGYTKALQFQKAYGDDPTAALHMHNSIQDDFYQYAVRDGKIDAGRAADWARTHQGTLQVYPDAMPNPTSLAQRQAELDTTFKQTGEDTLSTEISKVIHDQQTAEDFMAKAVSNDALGIKVWKAVKGDPAAEEAFTRHLFNAAPMDQTMEAFLNKPVVRQALGATHIANLRNIFKTSQMVANMPGIDVPMNIDPFSAVKGTTGLSAQSLLSRGYAYGRQVIGGPWLASDAVLRAFQQLKSTQTQVLLQKALYNPELARDLVAAGRRAGVGPLSAKGAEKAVAPLRNWLVFYGLEPAGVRH